MCLFLVTSSCCTQISTKGTVYSPSQTLVDNQSLTKINTRPIYTTRIDLTYECNRKSHTVQRNPLHSHQTQLICLITNPLSISAQKEKEKIHFLYIKKEKNFPLQHCNLNELRFYYFIFLTIPSPYNKGNFNCIATSYQIIFAQWHSLISSKQLNNQTQGSKATS